MRRPRLDAADYIQGVLDRDRALLGRAITLVESSHPRHQAMAQEVLTALLPHTGGAARVGITGVPGVGKSTFIERLGTELTAAGHRVAVLAVDPSSTITGGSILGDKTRMTKLSVDPMAFVRPSPSEGTLGGVARKTRETLLLCEAAGYDVVLVETVGVGQSEVVVAGMTDTFLALMLPGAGDELQGIKRGLLEVADLVVVNKADGDNVQRARLAAAQYKSALHLLRPVDPSWTPRVLTCSAQSGDNVAKVWAAVMDRIDGLRTSGGLTPRRNEQALCWMQTMVEAGLRAAFESAPGVQAARAELEAAVREGALPATRGASALLEVFMTSRPSSQR